MATEFYYTPQILRESAEGINRFDIRDEMLANRELELTGDLGARMPPGVLGCIPKCLAVLGPFVLSEARQDDLGLVDAVPARIVKKLLQLFVPQLVARPIGRGGDGGLAL